MGEVIQFQANLHPVTRVGFGHGSATQPTKLSVKIAQLTKAAREQGPTRELKPGSNWAWVVVQETAGQPDRMLVGGQSESMTEAAAQAQVALNAYEERLFVKKGGK